MVCYPVFFSKGSRTEKPHLATTKWPYCFSGRGCEYEPGVRIPSGSHSGTTNCRGFMRSGSKPTAHCIIFLWPTASCAKAVHAKPLPIHAIRSEEHTPELL